MAVKRCSSWSENFIVFTVTRQLRSLRPQAFGVTAANAIRIPAWVTPVLRQRGRTQSRPQNSSHPSSDSRMASASRRSDRHASMRRRSVLGTAFLRLRSRAARKPDNRPSLAVPQRTCAALHPRAAESRYATSRCLLRSTAPSPASLPYVPGFRPVYGHPGQRETPQNQLASRASPYRRDRPVLPRCAAVARVSRRRSIVGLLNSIFVHLSQSPSTMSMLPMAATTSAISRPSHILRSDCRFANEGERICTRYGLAVPSLTT